LITSVPFFVERKLGSKLASRKIGRPKKAAVDTDDLLETRL